MVSCTFLELRTFPRDRETEGEKKGKHMTSHCVLLTHSFGWGAYRGTSLIRTPPPPRTTVGP